MKPRLLASVLIASLLIIATIGTVSAYTVLDTVAAIRAEGQIPFTPQALLDNFDAGTTTNAWNCVTGTFAKEGTTASCTAVYYTNKPSAGYGGTGRSLQLKYNVNDVDSYAGYSSQMGSGSLTSPTAYTALSFYVRGAAGGEFFKIQLANNSTASYTSGTTTYKRSSSSVYITDYLDGGVTTGWQKVTIPFHNFANLDGFNSMKEFVIVFENSQSTTNGSTTSGTIYIDDIAFETTPISAVRIDHFGDKLGICALGGNMGTGVGGGAWESLNKYSFSNTTNEYDPGGYPNGLKLEYNVTTGFAYTFLIFGGGQDIDPNPATNKSGWIAIPHNFSAYTKLTFRIRARSLLENPIQIKVELVDSGAARSVAIGSISSTIWQVYELPLSSFDPSLDKTSIKQLTFVFEDWRITGAGGSKVGVVFIDSIQFE